MSLRETLSDYWYAATWASRRSRHGTWHTASEKPGMRSSPHLLVRWRSTQPMSVGKRFDIVNCFRLTSPFPLSSMRPAYTVMSNPFVGLLTEYNSRQRHGLATHAR